MKTLSCKIVGTTPLLMHAPTGVGAVKTTKKVTTYDPEDEAKKGLYVNKEGKIFVPAMALLGCLREAGKQHKAPGRGKQSLKALIMSGIRIFPEEVIVSPQTWEIDARTAVIQRQRIMRWRPRFDIWELSFDLKILDEDTLSPSQIREVLSDAGKYNGLLDFRPFFGTFTVKSCIDNDTKKEVK